MGACAVALKALAHCDDVKRAIATQNDGAALDVLLAALSQHIANAGIMQQALAAVAAVLLRHPAHADAVVAKGGLTLIVRPLAMHVDHPGVCKQSALAIRNLVARSKETIIPLLDEEGTKELLQAAQAKHPSINDPLYAAMRDCGWA